MKNTVFLVVISFVLIQFTKSSSAFDNQEIVKRARCLAHCITIVRSSAHDHGCHGDSCSQCSRGCHMISKSLVDCKASCANSTWCKKSCHYIETTIKKWKNIYTGDGTSIPKPTAPIATVRTVRSLTLSWQPVVNVIGGSVVYLLKKKYEQKDYKHTDDLPMVFTENKAVISVQDVCNNVNTRWFIELKFYFTVLALTENSSLVLGDVSKDIEMAKPDHVSKINFPQFSYTPSPKPNGNVIFRTNFVPPTTSHTKLITKYGVMLLTTTNCQKPAVNPKTEDIDKGKTDVKMTIFYKFLAGCNHTIKVYSVVHCVASIPKTLVYKYPGCFNIPNFDRKTCYSFDPPPTPKSSRRVRNLNHSQIQTDADFRFRVNVTWNRPSYPYYNTTTYEVTYGDESKTQLLIRTHIWVPDYTNDNFKGTRIEMKNLLPNIKYKYLVKARIPVVALIDVSGSFRTPELPKDELKIENVVPRSLGFSRIHFFSFNVSWEKPRFLYGNLAGFTIYTTVGNITTKNTFHLVRGIRHSEPFKMQIKPNYVQKWIVGSVKDIKLKGKEPNRTTLKVQSLKVHHQKDDRNDWYHFVMSWKAPIFQHKTIDYYQVTYSLTGYPYHALECKQGKVKKLTCGPTKTKNTTYEIVQVLPSEHIIFTVTPIFANSPYVKGAENTINIDAPYPRRDLVAVRNLTYNGVTTTNGTKNMVFSWENPLFTHSNASRYMVKYTIAVIGDNMANPTVKRRTMRSVNNQTRSQEITKSISATTFLAPLLVYNKEITVEVTPVFDVEIIVGERSTITITNPSDPTKISSLINPLATAGIVLGSFLALSLVVVLILWLIRRQKQTKEGVLVGRKGAVFDQWEVPVEKIYLEEDLGEGAFGKVFKAVLLELPEQSAKYSIAKSIRRKSLMPMKQDDGFVVAVKMLHDMADEEQRREFLKEIQLMKDVGSHRNIVNMLGCGTLSDPMFLIVEYLPNGDLLHYLRKRRGKATKYPDSDPRGPYHSTYCQTYFNKYKPEEGISVQASRSDRIYVHSPENNKEANKDDIELHSVQKFEADNSEDVSHNNGIMASDKFGFDDETLTSGDLMAFAWQVSQGMEYLSKRGYVHRDLAARNILVGNNKEAKIADFGLTRQMYEDLYQAKTNRRLPLKWMSVEAIFDQSFTSQSDVWAYGVFLWELVTLGGTPYPSINNRELLKLLREGYRMEKPDTCDNELYEIMCSCWKELPEDRPTFEDLRSKLEEMMTRDNPYFDPSAVDESRDYYNVPSFNSAPDPEEDDDVIEDIFCKAASSKDNEFKIKFINKNNKKEQKSRDNYAFSSDLSHSGDPWVLQLDNDRSVNGHELLGLDLDVSDRAQNDSPIVEPKAKRTNTRYASLDFNDIEFQIYRHNNMGFEF